MVTNQFEFQGTEAFVSNANECYDKANAEHSKANVQDDVSAAVGLVRAISVLELFQLKIE